MLSRMTLRWLVAINLFLSFSLSSQAFAGIIGVGGTNTLQVQNKLKRAVEICVEQEAYRRLNMRLSVRDVVKAEIRNRHNQSQTADFMRVHVEGEPTIVDTDVSMKLKSEAP